jgi:predicted  nucleic acid-binding Zn-ribbon protein
MNNEDLLNKIKQLEEELEKTREKRKEDEVKKDSPNYW